MKIELSEIKKEAHERGYCLKAWLEKKYNQEIRI